jgi:hypothetical protein
MNYGSANDRIGNYVIVANGISTAAFLKDFYRSKEFKNQMILRLFRINR